MKINLVFLTVALLLCAAFVWGGGQAETPETGGKKVTLRVTTRGDAGSMDRDKIRISEFEKNYPNIKVQQEPWPADRFHEFTTQFGVQYESGTAADIVALDFEPLQHVLYGRLLPLTQWVENDPEFLDWNYWEKGQLDQFKYLGDYYALPRGLYTSVFWCNVDMFEEAGLNVPGWEWTIEDFVAYSKKLTKDTTGDGKIDQYGAQIFPLWHPYHIMAFIEPTNDKYSSWYTYDEKTEWVNGSNMEHPNVVKGLQFISDLYNVHKVTPSFELGDPFAMGLTFADGKIAIDTAGATWSMGGIKATGAGFNWAAAPYPTFTKGKPATHAPLLQRPTGSVVASTEHPEEAWTFLKYYSGYKIEKKVFENAKYLEFGNPRFEDSLILEDWLNQSPPGRKSLQLLLDSITQKRYNWAVENIVPQGNEKAVHIISDNAHQLLTGEVTAEEWVEDIHPKVHKTLEWTEETKNLINKISGGN